MTNRPSTLGAGRGSNENQALYRLGTTSYIQPDAILPNVRWLKDKARDIELVLFEVDDGPNNLPSPAEIQELLDLAAGSDLTYTVHLPLDLDCHPDGPQRQVSLAKARKVIACTLPLKPRAFIVHLDGSDLRKDPSPKTAEEWTARACQTLEMIAAWSGSYELLAVENLEGYPTDYLDGILARIPVSRCADVGHLWLDGHDPLPLLERWLPRTRVIHLHGLKEGETSAPGRPQIDHQSLAHITRADLQAVIDILAAQHYDGVVTLEVFNEADFLSSKEQVMHCQRN